MLAQARYLENTKELHRGTQTLDESSLTNHSFQFISSIIAFLALSLPQSLRRSHLESKYFHLIAEAITRQTGISAT